MASEITFVLRGRPFGGGANSVAQEFAALVDNYGMGRLLVEPQHLDVFRRGYDWSVTALDRLSADPQDIPDGAAIVATTNDSLSLVLDEFSERASRVYYYVQDYEPLFYPRHSRQHTVAIASYGRAKAAVAVVKTDWLAQVLMSRTFFPVVKIRPSLDRTIYRPRPLRADGHRRTLVAMLRPSTPRRGSQRTVAVINRLAQSASLALDIEVFGTSNDELGMAGLRMSPRIRNHGRVSPKQAAEIVCSSDFLLDLSDYQAFGRTVAEGLAAGVVPIVTDRGAPPSYVTHGVSGFLVTPSDIDAAYDYVKQATRLPDDELAAMRLAAMEAVSEWSVDATASDWFALTRDS